MTEKGNGIPGNCYIDFSASYAVALGSLSGKPGFAIAEKSQKLLSAISMKHDQPVERLESINEVPGHILSFIPGASGHSRVTNKNLSVKDITRFRREIFIHLLNKDEL